MPSTVTEVYKWVVDDVVEKCQELFAQEGVEPSVLNELRETWLKKLHDSGVMGDPNDEPPPRANLHTDHSRSLSRPRPQIPRRITDHRAAAFAANRPNPGNPMAHHLGLNAGLPRVDPGLRQVQTVALGVPQANLSTPAMILSQEYVPGLMTNGYLQWGQSPVGYLSQVPGQLSVLGNLQAVQSVAGNSTSVPGAHTTSQPGGISSTGQAFHPQQYVTPSGYQVARVSGVQTPGIQQYPAHVPASGNGSVPGQLGISTGLTSAPNRALPQGGQVVYSVVQNVAGKRKIVDDGSSAPAKMMRLDNIAAMRKPGEGGGTSSNPNGGNPNTSILKMDGNHGVPIPGRIPQQDGASDDRTTEEDNTKSVDKETDEKSVEKNDGGTSAQGGEGTVDDPLGSDEDPPLTDDDDEEEIESANFLTAQYDKVSRIKTRWRCQLKFGIFHANGRDYLFKTASGEFEF